ncbi:MAG: hypothetical protein ACR2O6_11830 [Ilumatobacteraceae bacterium]
MASFDSSPSARRVAQDLVETYGADDPEARDCMLQLIEDEYPGDTLDKIGEGVEEGNPDAIAALDEFESQLRDCR